MDRYDFPKDYKNETEYFSECALILSRESLSDWELFLKNDENKEWLFNFLEYNGNNITINHQLEFPKGGLMPCYLSDDTIQAYKCECVYMKNEIDSKDIFNNNKNSEFKTFNDKNEAIEFVQNIIKRITDYKKLKL